MLENTNVKEQFTIADSATFDFGVRFFSPNDITCYEYNPNTKIETRLSSGTDYSIEEKTDYSSGAKVTLLGPLTSGNILTIVRTVLPQQKVSLPNFGKIPSESLATQLDRTVAVQQQLVDKINMVYQPPYGANADPAQAIKDLVGSGVDHADYANSAGFADHASTADVATMASSLDSAVYSAVKSDIAGYAMDQIKSGGTAYYASSAGVAGTASGLTSAAKSSIVSDVVGSIGGGTADYASSAGRLTSDGLAAIITLSPDGGVDDFQSAYTSDGSAFEYLYEGGAFGGVAMVEAIHPGGNTGGGLNHYTVPTAAAVYKHCQYKGPFAVLQDDYSPDDPEVNISAGAVVIGPSRYYVDESSTTLSSGYNLWLIGSSGASSVTFEYSAVSSGGSPSVSSGMFAHCICERGGTSGFFITQLQKGDIITVPWGITASGGGGTAAYNGPFAVTTSGTKIIVNGGRMYLAGSETSEAGTSMTSSNGNVYYYLYYSGGSYISGYTVASSPAQFSGGLSAAVYSSQGVYYALGNVSGGSVTQYHYGDIHVDGRWV